MRAKPRTYRPMRVLHSGYHNVQNALVGIMFLLMWPLLGLQLINGTNERNQLKREKMDVPLKHYSIYIWIVQSRWEQEGRQKLVQFKFYSCSQSPALASKWACLSLHGRIENKIFLNPFYFILFYFIRKTLSIQFEINSK